MAGRPTRSKSRSFVSVLTRGESTPSPTSIGARKKPSRSPEVASIDEPQADPLAREEPRRDLVRVDEFLYNPVLLPRAAMSTATTPTAAQASALERAQAVALAERVLHSVQVGRIQGGHLVRLRLSSEVEVELRHCDGVLQATVVGDGDQGPLARRLDAELRARGLRFDRVELG